MYTKPYIWRLPFVPNSQITVYNWRERITNYLLFQEGIRLPGTDMGRLRFSQDPATYDLIFDAECAEEKLTKMGVISNTASALLVNSEVLKVFKEVCPDDFQAFPTLVRGVNPKYPPFELTHFWLLNVTNLSGKLDVERSKKCKQLVLFPDHMEGHHLSRLTEDRHEIIISQTLYKALKKLKMRGLIFEKDAEGKGTMDIFERS
ncbi:MAG: imm11 family protein [Alphaproteobacteria bacterium]|jgi:hypothetical protein|nr:hypothetical protein [Alphaproteobacteria bacterium]